MSALADLAGVWDIECASWDRFKVGAFLRADGLYYVSWDAHDFFAALTSQKGIWYAHAGGRYDALWLADMCAKLRVPWTAKPRGSGLLSISLNEIEIRDSFALVPMSLEKAAPIGGAVKLKVGLPCECGKSCGGFCVLDRDLTPDEVRKVERYLHGDCEALYSMLVGLAERCEKADITPSLTVGGTAWGTAKRWSDLPNCEHDVGLYTVLRGAYYGGRVEVYNTVVESGHRYDIHSSYPAALSRQRVPIGNPRIVVKADAERAFESGAIGLYTATVFVPECLSPPLPVHIDGRLLYPWGRIEGMWTWIELQHAVEHGARIESIANAWLWAPEQMRSIAEYADRIWSIRDVAAANPEAPEQAWSAWVKWCANSLTGKLGQRPNKGDLLFCPSVDGEAPDLDDIGYDEETDEIVRETDAGVYVLKKRMRVDSCAHVQAAATLTSVARVELHRQILHALDLGMPVYCDTDSVYATTELTRRVGPNLGEWGHEGAMEKWGALAPKVYRYFDPKKKKWIVKGKGMSGLTSEGYDALKRGEPWVIDRGVDGIKTSLRRGNTSLFKRKSLSRKLWGTPGWIGGRILCSDGSTCAPSLAQYNAADSVRKKARNEAAKARKKSEK